MSSLLRAFSDRRLFCLFWLGISSGLPLLLIGSTFKGWMTELGLSLETVGAIALVQMPYTFKFVWAPLMDRYVPPFLDRRRGWILICQCALAIALVLLGYSNPSERLAYSAALCVLVAFLSASQDTAIDAYRREILGDAEQGLGASLAVGGYRTGMFIAGAGAFVIADHFPWSSVYVAMAGVMLLGMGATVFAPSLKDSADAPKTLATAVVGPFKEFLLRPGAFEVLLFILLFKLGDQMASDMFIPFYLKVGYLKTEIAAISKVYGLWATLLGGILGGVILLRVEQIKCLWAFGILQGVSTLGYSWLAYRASEMGPLGSPGLSALAAVVTFENVCSGMGTAAYVAFMASLTDKRFTATQYALLSSLMSVPRTVFGASSGAFAAHLGWVGYFSFCGFLALPGLLMLTRHRRWTNPSSAV
jgi:MFS transporter, PAT family, beta-lactamase induction signal transducer AmpG